MIEVTLNKKKKIIEGGLSVADLLECLERSDSNVWINDKQIKQEDFQKRIIEYGDIIKILPIIIGG